MISYNRKHPERKKQSPVYPVTRPRKPDSDVNRDSDDTVIYEPPAELPKKPSKPAKSVKGKAVFTIRTIGIKVAKDAETIRNIRK